PPRLRNAFTSGDAATIAKLQPPARRVPRAPVPRLRTRPAVRARRRTRKQRDQSRRERLPPHREQQRPVRVAARAYPPDVSFRSGVARAGSRSRGKSPEMTETVLR